MNLFSDYEEFHLSQITFLNTREHSNSRCESMPSLNYQRLRREVYHLKDQIRDCIDELNLCLQHFHIESRANTELWMSIRSSFRSMKNSLETMLSNNPSDWIDYGLSGGLTYAKFHELNPDTIRSLSLQLKDVVEELGYQRMTTRSLGSLTRVAELQADSQLDSLFSIEEVLASLFRTRSVSASGRDELDEYGRRLATSS
jgi:hypothetical protein